MTRSDAGAPDPANVANLGRTVRRGAMISGVAMVVVQVVWFAQVLVMARLLSPSEVGIFAAGAAISTFLVSFADQSLGAALIQREHDVEATVENTFWVTAVVGLVLSGVALAVAPLIGLLFGNPTIGLVAATMSGTLLLQALTVVPDCLMQRRFNFRRRLIVDPSVAISFAVVSVSLALNGFGLWSMVWATYASLVTWVVATWLLARWRPGVSMTSWNASYGLIRFAVPLILGSIGEKLRELSETVIVGRVLGEATLGQFRYGRRLSQIPSMATIQIGGYVLFPALSRIANDAVRLKRGFLRALSTMWLCAVPLGALMVALGVPLVVLLLGERWQQAGVALVAMAGFAPGVALSVIGFECIKSCGRSRLLNQLSLLSLVGGIAMLVALVPFGLVGVGIAVSVEALVLGTFTLLRASQLAGVSVREIAGRVFPPLLSAVVALAAIGPVEHFLVQSATRPVAAGIGLLVLEGLAFVAIYLVMLRVFAPAATAALFADARRLRQRRRRPAPASATVDRHE